MSFTCKNHNFLIDLTINYTIQIIPNHNKQHNKYLIFYVLKRFTWFYNNLYDATPNVRKMGGNRVPREGKWSPVDDPKVWCHIGVSIGQVWSVLPKPNPPITFNLHTKPDHLSFNFLQPKPELDYFLLNKPKPNHLEPYYIITK